VKPYKIPVSVLVVIYTADLHVLLMERANKFARPSGLWQSVTGSLDTDDEPFELAARREVLEETGIDSHWPGCVLKDWRTQNIYALLPAWRHRYAPEVTHNTEHVFGLQVPVGTPVTLSAREHVAYQWLPYSEAAERCFSASNAQAVLMLPSFT
jgi:dihydroneopterin triphosphate diphosphatase